MAQANLPLIKSIRNTAQKLKNGAPYQWGHMGSCNCGHLAQEIAHLSKEDIHDHAMRSAGSWTEQSQTYCPTSGCPMDLMITAMIEAGLAIDDLKHLERLSDPTVLKRIPVQKRKQIKHNYREHVVLYLKAWASMLEEQLVEEIEVKSFVSPPVTL